MSVTEQRLEQRIAAQEALIDRRLEKVPSQQIQDFYWGPLKPAVWGINASPRPGRSILSQLLLTPTLIVDVLPMEAAEFIKTYGVDPSQMLSLAQEGYIVPNFYHYKNEGWRKYARHPIIAEMLADYGRPNTEWIKSYLEKCYGFSAIESEAAEFFRSISLSSAERERILAACHGRIDTWASFAPVVGQRLAYIQVLGGESFSDVVAWIRDAYKGTKNRGKAIQLLIASKHLVATETTAAFGGHMTYVPEDLSDIKASIGVLKDLTPLLKLSNRRPRRSISKPANQFIEELLKRARALKLPSMESSSRRPPGLLSSRGFKKFKKVLSSIRDGRLGWLIDGMTEALFDPERALEPTVDEYRQLAAELDRELRFLTPLASLLASTGSVLIRADEMAPPTDLPVGWFFLLGNKCKVLAGTLDRAEIMRPFFMRRYPRRLCADWRAVKRALGLSAYGA